MLHAQLCCDLVNLIIRCPPPFLFFPLLGVQGTADSAGHAEHVQHVFLSQMNLYMTGGAFCYSSYVMDINSTALMLYITLNTLEVTYMMQN